MWQFMSGCVIIQCTGRNLSRFLNLLRANGIPVNSVRGMPGGDLSLAIRAHDFRKLRPLVRQSGCKVHIVQRSGVPFLLWRLGRRPILWVGMLVVMGALLFASTRILHIRIEGCQRLPETLVLRALEEQGIKRFGAYPESDLESISALMRLYDERIAWISLDLTGSCLEVKVTELETAVPTVDAGKSCDVVAVKDGIIRTIEVYEGHSDFSAGDQVRAGDVLIAGEYFPQTNEVMDAPMNVHARGSITAEVYYFSEFAAESTETVFADTDASVQYRKISLWGISLSESAVPFEHYEIRDVVTRPFVEGILPILVAEGTCYEQTQQSRPRTRAEQTEVALSTAEQLAYLKIPKDAAVVQKLQRTTVEDGVVIGVVCIVTEETIGLERAHE